MSLDEVIFANTMTKRSVTSDKLTWCSDLTGLDKRMCDTKSRKRSRAALDNTVTWEEVVGDMPGHANTVSSLVQSNPHVGALMDNERARLRCVLE